MEESFAQALRIPKDRVAVVIGEKGSTKREIERETKTKINIGSDGEVEIKGESFGCWTARQIVKAIGRGVKPDDALLILDDEYGMEIIELREITDSDKAMERLKGRVIGKAGRTREIIEELTGCSVTVYGKTITVIGKYEFITVAMSAINMLLDGAMHSTVYRFLERETRNS